MWHINRYIEVFGIKRQIRNQQPKKLPGTKSHSNQVTFCILVSHIRSAILNSWNLSSDS